VQVATLGIPRYPSGRSSGTGRRQPAPHGLRKPDQARGASWGPVTSDADVERTSPDAPEWGEVLALTGRVSSDIHRVSHAAGHRSVPRFGAFQGKLATMDLLEASSTVGFTGGEVSSVDVLRNPVTGADGFE
jgi:hypothetical protein